MVLNWLLTQGIAHPTGSWHRCGLWPLKRKLEVEGKAAWTICQTELQILSAPYPPKKKKVASFIIHQIPDGNCPGLVHLTEHYQ